MVPTKTRLGEYSPSEEEIHAFLYCREINILVEIVPVKDEALWQLRVQEFSRMKLLEEKHPPGKIWEAYFNCFLDIYEKNMKY